MKEFSRKVTGGLVDLRVIVGFFGALLSVASHEVFHIVMHSGEIEAIRLFPNPIAIVEVTLRPGGDYDLMFEEMVAYTITMVVLLMTVMLICEIHDARDGKSARQTISTKGFVDNYPETDELKMLNHLGILLGIGTTTHEPVRDGTRK